jgi:hypothetical protein
MNQQKLLVMKAYLVLILFSAFSRLNADEPVPANSLPIPKDAVAYDVAEWNSNEKTREHCSNNGLYAGRKKHELMNWYYTDDPNFKALVVTHGVYLVRAKTVTFVPMSNISSISVFRSSEKPDQLILSLELIHKLY